MANGSAAKKNKAQDLEEDDFFSRETAPDVGKHHEDLEIDGWYEPEMGVVVAGVFKSILVIQDEEDGPRKVALIELKRPIKAKLDDVPIDLAAGKILAVGARAKLEPLFNYVDGARVWFRPIGKKKLKGKRQAMWQFELVIDGKERPPAPAAPF